MDIALATLFDEHFVHMGRVATRNKFEYCSRHDYSFHLLRHRLMDPPTMYSKIPFLETILPLHDWVVWMDADTLIMNFNTRLESYLDDRFSMVIGEDWNGINNGVFFLKRDEWSLDFLKRSKAVPREGLSFFDQSQMSRVLAHDTAAKERVKLIPLKQCGGHGDFNCYPTENRAFPRDERYQYFDHGDFVIHFVGSNYGGDGHRRFLTKLLKQYAAEVIR